jgi:hypothetical protein
VIPDEEVRVIVLPREYGWWLTPEGEEALDAADLRSRAIADEARELARRRRIEGKVV